MTDVLFYAFSAAIVIFSLLVVTLKNLLHAALSLIAAFAITAGLYILLNAEFVAVAQVMVYIGGVVIFIVFAILLVTKLGEISLPSNNAIKLVSFLIASGVFIPLAFFLRHVTVPGQSSPEENFSAGSLEAVGQRLMNIGENGFIVPFELISLLLLAAVIGAITVARKSVPKDSEKGTV